MKLVSRSLLEFVFYYPEKDQIFIVEESTDFPCTTLVSEGEPMGIYRKEDLMALINQSVVVSLGEL